MKLSIDRLRDLLPDLKVDRRGKYVRASCPNCGHYEFTMSLSDGHPCGCNRKKHCGYISNIFGVAKKLGKLSLLNIEGEVGLIEKLENKLLVLETPLDLTLPKSSLPVGWKRIYHDEYLESRGFTVYDYTKYMVGRTAIDPKLKNNYVVFAIEDDNEVKGYISRHVWDKERIDKENKIRKKNGLKEIARYLNSDTDFSKLLLGYDEIIEGQTDTIIVVEGLFDKHNTDKLLNLDAEVSMKCNATFKCHISPEQVLKWKNKGIENLVLFYDPDVIKQIKEVAAYAEQFFKVLIAFNEQGDDPGAISYENLKNTFNSLQSPGSFFINKINLAGLNY